MRANSTAESGREWGRRARQLSAGCIVALLLSLAVIGTAAAATVNVYDLNLNNVDVNDPDGDIFSSQSENTINLAHFDNDDNEWIYNQTAGPGQAFGRAYLNFSFDVQVGTGGYFRGANVGLSTGPNGTIPGLNFYWRDDCGGVVSTCARVEDPSGTQILQAEDQSADAGDMFVTLEYVHATEELHTRIYNTSDRVSPWYSVTTSWDNSTDLDTVAVWDVHSGVKHNTDHNIQLYDYNVTIVGETERVEIRGISADQINRNETVTYEVYAILSDGSELKVTGTATEQSNRTDILTVDDQGTAQAQDAAGHVRVNATYEGLETQINTTVYNRTLEDIRFVDGPVASIAVLLDMGIWMLFAIALFASMGCERIWEEEIAIMLFVAGTAVIWLLGFAGIYLPVAAVLVGGSMAFSPLGPPH